MCPQNIFFFHKSFKIFFPRWGSPVPDVTRERAAWEGKGVTPFRLSRKSSRRGAHDLMPKVRETGCQMSAAPPRSRWYLEKAPMYFRMPPGGGAALEVRITEPEEGASPLVLRLASLGDMRALTSDPQSCSWSLPATGRWTRE